MPFRFGRALPIGRTNNGELESGPFFVSGGFDVISHPHADWQTRVADDFSAASRMYTEADWLAAFIPAPGEFVEAAECELATSLRAGTTPLDVVRALLRHSGPRLRGCVGWALNEVTKNLADYLPAIYDGIDDPSPEVRIWCTLSLRMVRGDDAIEAIVRSFGLLRDTVGNGKGDITDIQWYALRPTNQ